MLVSEISVADCDAQLLLWYQTLEQKDCGGKQGGSITVELSWPRNTTCSHTSCICPGDTSQMGTTEINKEPAVCREGWETRGAWAAARSSFYSRAKAQS